MPQQEMTLMAHLLRRAGFGATRDELEASVAKGYEAMVGAPPTRRSTGHARGYHPSLPRRSAPPA